MGVGERNKFSVGIKKIDSAEADVVWVSPGAYYMTSIKKRGRSERGERGGKEGGRVRGDTRERVRVRERQEERRTHRSEKGKDTVISKVCP